MKKKHIVAALLSITSLTATAATDTAKLSLNRNNIKVWTYQTENNPIIQYRAETTFDVPLERAVAVVLDVERTPQWVPYVGKAQVLSRDEKKGEFILYMVLDFPFPLKDRDLVIKGKMSKNADGSISIKNNVIQNNYPEQPDVVRLTKYTGDWTFQRVGNNKVKVTTTGYADPAGSIPLSFVNMFVQQQPYQMLMKMKKEVNNPLYAQPHLPDLLK
ncbi:MULTISPECIES: START domain-containing protein [Acinetobacter]|uniref:START domain-containing protein n=1 Tax=Acinetobacter corruptisaponis TaxID=3045147 RepID=A0ABY8RZP4_9GAMM|nr:MULTISPECIES: START domain-containing protein [Acinetobacter]MDH0032703.1 START domain-containing protein [Acinetobacter sp. GD04021]MDH0888138.1 START domain-containing protein [Acinetobacter sp. GD03873]MDH1084489.1 START domain-containing protein [Acinetobacter sp. GD03983]MDH2191455.1 START domain-containing protein [Acinetobacter sp. GD03645]MDH2205028.1 START domain-containing protein [Acinetobacter sp. GD03647]